jgi:glutaredoxin 3
MSETEVVVYSTGWCPYCDRAKSLLGRKEVAFREVKVDEDPAERDAMLKRSGGRRTVPQIFIGDRHVGGYDELYALEKTGELDKLLGRA